jgi:hypothetical protein
MLCAGQKRRQLVKRLVLVLFVVSVVMVLATGNALAKGRGDGPVIYVVSQGLFYDSIVAADPLPPKGPFQLLYECEVDGVTGLCTEYGPRNFGYVGGRWWVDVNDDGMMDEEDAYFSCPLLGPGREMP